MLTVSRSRTLKGSDQQPLQALESSGVGQLPTATCQAGRYPEERWQDPASGYRRSVGSYRPDGGQAGPGAEVGETLPPEFLWVSAKQVRAPGTGTDPEALDFALSGALADGPRDDTGWRGNYPVQSFDFLGYTFRPRSDKSLRDLANMFNARIRGHRRRASHWLDVIARQNPRLFAHWPLLYG